MRGGRVLVQVVAAVAVLVTTVVSPSAQTAQASAPTGAAQQSVPAATAEADPVWSAPVTAIPDRGQPSDVSCPSTTWCMAIDLSGQVLTFDGTTWSSPRKIFPKAPGQPQSAVSCPTTTFCLATHASGYAVYRSGSWTVTRSALAPFRTVGCYSATRCALIRGDVFSSHAMAYWNGSSLTSSVNMPWAYRVDAVSCVSVTTCLAIGVEPSGGAIALRSSGATWVASYLGQATRFATLDLSCTSTSFCLATSGNSYRSWRWNGTSWRAAAETRDGIYLDANVVSCVSTTSCTAAGYGRVGRWNGTSWSVRELFPIIGATYAVDCPSSSTCVIVDDRGRWWRGGGSTWSAARSFDTTTGSGVADLSCPTSSFCMATDQVGNAFRWEGATWSGPSRLGTMSSSVSCPSSSWCMTVDSQQSTSRIWNGSWGAVTGVDYVTLLRPAECASTTACFVFEAGDVRRWNGRAWSASTQLFAPTGMDVRLDCAGSRFCIAMTDDGLFRTWNGSSWSAARRSGVTNTNQLTCTSSTFCMVESDSDLYSTFNGSSWSVRRTLPAGGGRFGCQSSTRCVMASDDGTAYWWAGGPWVASANRIGFLPSRIACAPTRCMAVGYEKASWTL
ncbi:hypothetical protein [Terrabacter sp. NPDC000476]|uniref:hypothetical protein n=1 Tax=Terrabacter sp. NPDC000476 TaxID=3154258 RepID=UPI00332E6EE9